LRAAAFTGGASDPTDASEASPGFSFWQWTATYSVSSVEAAVGRLVEQPLAAVVEARGIGLAGFLAGERILVGHLAVCGVSLNASHCGRTSSPYRRGPRTDPALRSPSRLRSRPRG
jgi:hypothetical protein